MTVTVTYWDDQNDFLLGGCSYQNIVLDGIYNELHFAVECAHDEGADVYAIIDTPFDQFPVTQQLVRIPYGQNPWQVISDATPNVPVAALVESPDGWMFTHHRYRYDCRDAFGIEGLYIDRLARTYQETSDVGHS